jgi:hypothetical protein
MDKQLILNPELHYVGKLCKYGHKYNNENLSIRYKSCNLCVMCRRFKNHENYDKYKPVFNDAGKRRYKENREEILKKRREEYARNRENYKERNRNDYLKRQGEKEITEITESLIPEKNSQYKKIKIKLDKLKSCKPIDFEDKTSNQQTQFVSLRRYVGLSKEGG